MSELAPIAIEPADAAIRANPYIAETILANRTYPMRIHAAGVIWVVHKPGDPAGLRLELIQSGPGADPDNAAAVFKKCGNHIGAQAIGMVRIVLETREPLGSAVEAVEAAAGRAQPKRPAAVLQKRKNVVVPQRGRIQWIIFVNGHAITVVPEQPILRAKPHEALAVLQDTQNGTGRQALLPPDALKFEFERLRANRTVCQKYKKKISRDDFNEIHAASMYFNFC